MESGMEIGDWIGCCVGWGLENENWGQGNGNWRMHWSCHKFISVWPYSGNVVVILWYESGASLALILH